MNWETVLVGLAVLGIIGTALLAFSTLNAIGFGPDTDAPTEELEPPEARRREP